MQTTKTVVVNVGGTKFETTRDTLNRSGFFEAALNRTTEGETLFVDRCPVAFVHVLNVLRKPDCAIPEEYADELGFYLPGVVQPTTLSVSSCLETLVSVVESLKKTAETHQADTRMKMDQIYHRVDGVEEAVKKLVEIKKINWDTCRCCSEKVEWPGRSYCDGPNCYNRGCWTTDARLFVATKGWTPAGEVGVGDRILTDGTPSAGNFACVLSARRSEPVPQKKMCLVNGTWFTHGHPVFTGNEWKLARDVGVKVVLKQDVVLFNLVLDHTHTVVFESGAKAATLGRFASGNDLS